MINTAHWTERSVEDFAYSVASDFVELLREKMDKLGWSNTRLAKAASVSKGRVSQIFKDPGNLEIVTMAKFARALRMKMAAFPYEDIDDPNNERGPINSEIFRICWENSKRPADMWAIKQMAVPQTTANSLDLKALLSNLEWGLGIFNKTSGNNPQPNLTGGVAPGFSYQIIASGRTQTIDDSIKRR